MQRVWRHVCVCVTWCWLCLSFLHSSLRIMGPHWLLPFFSPLAHSEEALAVLIKSVVICCCWKPPQGCSCSKWAHSPALKETDLDSDRVGEPHIIVFAFQFFSPPSRLFWVTDLKSVFRITGLYTNIQSTVKTLPFSLSKKILNQLLLQSIIF